MDVAKWKATARMIWRQECSKVANATIAFTEAVRLNHQLSSKVDNFLAKLLRIRLDGDELFARCKGLQEEKKDLASKVEGIAVESDELAKLVANLKVWLKDLESRLEDSKLQVDKEREANKELEEEQTMYKKEAMEQHEKGFQKAIRQFEFFAKDFDLGLFDPFKDVKDNVLLDREEIAAEEE